MSNLFALSSLHLVDAEIMADIRRRFSPPVVRGGRRDDAEQLLEVRWVPRWSSKV
ncbi:hypothetical protein [Amycolatopsis jiangsuensis]|uniref:Uncharacterized protein n=1 Tax=Amycolatopsis jiangsuensis TaxID=1181879 RepID=A0A840IXR2_9PSEU|nr:hypothetical protein [Amycolatopsis jiangsuensis]MBB4686503.1 hypothetical protein [Amycolatopsis jiangsuensis]